MRPYETLTPKGQVRRLRAVAEAAIGLWPVEVARLRQLADATSVTYRIDATDGTRYALRVARPGEMDLIQAGAEFTWLTWLGQHHPELGAPRPLPARDGRRLVPVVAPGVPGPCHCALLTWIPGVTPGKASTPADHRRLGALMARLHDAAEGFTPPPDFAPARWDRICYFPNDPEVLFDPENAEWVPPARIPTLMAAWDRCKAALEDMARWPGQMILHGDLHPWNVHRVRDRLRPLDFADLIWGHPIQDVAITLFYLTERHDFPTLRGAFFDGYTATRPWPGDGGVDGIWPTIETLHMARSLMFCNYIVRALPAYRETLPKRYDRLEAWMKRG